jgi:hypothetical protein
MSSEPACANRAFNITNTDLFRWRSLWPKIADAFDIPCGEVKPVRLITTMKDREQLWLSTFNKYRLQPLPLSSVSNWVYLDVTVERYWDKIMNQTKSRKFSFDDWDDSEKKSLELLHQYQHNRILPV